MTLESDPVRESDTAPNAGGKANTQGTSRVPALPSTEIIRKPEKDFWDRVKTGAEISGIILLAVYTLYTIKMYHANKQAADAATKAADTAKDALHISERAYLTDGAPSINIPTRSISIPIINSGHIPSGAVEVVIHEATVNVATPTAANTDLRVAAIERHWGRYNFQSIPPGWPIAIAIPAPKISETDLNSGRQTILIAGFIAYGDGFPDTPRQQWFFCQRTTFQTVMKLVLLGPCKPGDDTLHKLEMLDGYPNNAEP